MPEGLIKDNGIYDSDSEMLATTMKQLLMRLGIQTSKKTSQSNVRQINEEQERIESYCHAFVVHLNAAVSFSLIFTA